MTKRFKLQKENQIAHRVSRFLHLPVIAAIAILLSSLLLFPSFAASEIYKWKDSNGNMIFSDSPPSGANAEEVKNKMHNRFDGPPSMKDDKPKTGKANKTEPKLRDTRDINVVMYMTDW